MNIFLILPYKAEYEDVYEVVKNIVQTQGHNITRAEDFEHEGDILQAVESAINDADIIIADLTKYDDNKKNINSNVRSEFLKAETHNKPIIPIYNRSTELSVDLSDYQAILYDRLRMQETLVKPLQNYLSQNHMIDFLLKKTKQPKGKQAKLKSIFVSYSHNDTEYLNRLKIHLRPFEKKGQIDLWVDTKIKAGEKWKDKINNALENSVIAILLISADFLASDFIVDNELPPLLKSAEEKGKVILPIIVKPCRFTNDENLSKFQAINDPKNPLSKLNDNDREEMYVKVADFIDNLVK